MMIADNLLTSDSIRKQKVAEGVNIILSLFTLVEQQRIFPRTIMTKSTRGQIIVNSVDEIIKRFEEAKFEDCRINAYPAFVNKAEETDYEKGINMDLFTPNILFIDLDQKDFPSKEKLDKTLNKIQKHIVEILPGSQPLILWSGRGYHIIIPVQAPSALEHFEDFEGLTYRPSEELLQFAKKYLSLDKADKANNPAFKSCLLRVPYTFNSKCFNEGTDPEVKVAREIDILKLLPKIDNLLIEFLTFLADRKLKTEVEKEKRTRIRNRSFAGIKELSNKIPYVEKLLIMGIEDYRKNAVSLIIVPYCVNILGLPDESSYNMAREWILKCHFIKPVKPSISFFENLIKSQIKYVKRKGIKPLKFKDTLRYKNDKLCEILDKIH